MLWTVALLIAPVAVSFAIIYRDTGSRLRAQIDKDVSADSTQLMQSLRLLSADPPAGVLAGARRYIHAQPFESTSTLLFVLSPGAKPVSNYPELFRPSSPDDGESPAAQHAENLLSARLDTPQLGERVRDLPDVGAVELRERRLSVAGLPIVAGAGQPLVSVTLAQRDVVKSFVLAGGFIVLAVLLGSFLLGTRITAPLRRMARVASLVDAGDLEHRMTAERNDEVGVLAAAFNHMLQRLDDAFQGQREFIADASHELRTPLTVIQGQLEVLANRRNPTPAEVRRVERLVHSEIVRMRRLVDDLLLLAQTERPDFLRLESVDLQRFITQLRDDATLIADRRFSLGEIPSGELLADPDRLAQALRNLINNAIDHTTPGSGTIRIEVLKASHDAVRISVADDGPGIPDAELDRVFERFHRTSASRAARLGGAGLGLAIVRAIVEAHGGEVSVANAGIDGGARFELRLSGFGRLITKSANAAGRHPKTEIPAPTAATPRRSAGSAAGTPQ
jgi:signal transduction histidine kinase